jgi:hypothetical protein
MTPIDMAFLGALGFLFTAVTIAAYLLFRTGVLVVVRGGKPSPSVPRQGSHAGLALMLGPLFGLFMGLLYMSLTPIDPLDVNHMLGQLTLVGTIVGLITGAALGLAHLLACRMKPAGKPGRAGDTDLE